MPETNIHEIEYFEERARSLSDIASNIKTGNCVLVLGPMFGINKGQRPIYEDIKNFLREEDGSLMLDNEFQNLYLVEKMDSYDQTEIEEMIFRSYERFSADNIYKFPKAGNDESEEDIYTTIAKIKFSAFINFSQDIFLNNAFDRNENLKYQFTYLSIYQTQVEFEKLSNDPEYKNAPFIYNLFGHYQHKQSLIYSYDRFYKFFFKTLGESNENNVYPPEIVKRLSDARIFILLGFDLKKWYVPIFIAKLCRIGRENKEDRPMVLTALNNTNLDNLTYVGWLTRYPLKLKFIKDTYDFINQLSKIPGVINEPKVPLGHEPSNNEEEEVLSDRLSEEERNDFYDRISDVGDDDELLNLINELKSIYENKKNNGAVKFMTNTRSDTKILKVSKRSNKINRDDYKVEFAQIRDRILDYI
ncbi:SIR2 family protein [Mucilaginibacter sp.]|uniref:SIR2 family protein n=1 Tax=Mucilaginibacter sp. TaxID=1882438 RepID=UPI00261F281B|nr:SIR2 family protein [Mucilaginibacter sp.]MDB4921825.1 hypothetical protein [Mucilaginibacter sp.]